MKGYRKIIVLTLISAVAIYLALKGYFNEVISDFLKWLYGLFAVSNAVEHISERYNAKKDSVDNIVNNFTSDELKRTAEKELRIRDRRK